MISKYVQKKIITWANENGIDKLIPSSIEELSNITELNINHVPLTDVVRALNNLRTLKELTLYDCELTELPYLGGLFNLTLLSICNNDLKELPSWLHELTKLQTLDLSNNPNICNMSGNLALNVFGLPSLTHLMLNNTGLVKLPKWVSGLPNLEELTICNNPIGQLPSNIKSKNLKYLDVTKTWIKVIPKEIITMIRNNKGVVFTDFGTEDYREIPKPLVKTTKVKKRTAKVS